MTTKKFALLFVFTVFSLWVRSQPWEEHGKLQVSKVNPHYLAFQDGKPFFWLADTGWEMLHRLNREEIDQYLENRKEKGFNVILTVIISELENKGNTASTFRVCRKN